MSKIDSTIAAPPVRESRSLHDIFSGFFLNHVGSSSPTAVGLATPFSVGSEDEGASSSPTSTALASGTHFEVDDLKLMEPIPDVTSFATSSRMRRSETWTSAFHKSLPPSSTYDVTADLPDVRFTSDVISFTASGGSDSSYPGNIENGLSFFRKSLTDIFNPQKTAIVDPRDRSSSTGSSGVFSDPAPDLDTPLTPDPLSRSRPLSLPTLPSESGGHETPGAEISSPASPKSKPPVRRESTLSAVAETDPSSELRKMESVDINHNSDSPGGVTSSTFTRSVSYGGDSRASGSETLTHAEEVKVPEVRTRRLAILELFERKTVRNKDVNAMAPQSW